MNDLGFAGEPYKINNQGEVVGQLDSPTHAFVWQAGDLLDIGTLGKGGQSLATGVNNRGEVVGQASAQIGLHAFAWWRAQGMTDLGTLDGEPGSTSGANALNDQGQIVGVSYSHTIGTSHAAYFSPSGVIDLGSLGGDSWALGINNLGQVVGQSATASGVHGFLTDLDSRHMVDINDLIPSGSGWDVSDAAGINDAGQIIGSGRINGHLHACVLTPDESSPAAPVAVLFQGREVPKPIGATGDDQGPPRDLLVSPHVPQTEEEPTFPREPTPVARPAFVLNGMVTEQPPLVASIDPMGDVLRTYQRFFTIGAAFVAGP
jgi:probable HAF family extracellular repeat protein